MASRILLICGTLEFAKSGVADYINGLARELTRQGLSCACIALHDPHVAPSDLDLGLGWELNAVPVFRLSSQLPWSVRATWLQSAVADLQPDWISLHYVPYAFHRKGLPLGLLRCLAAVKTEACWELMAHELWVDPGGGLRMRILSRLQLFILSWLMKMLRPRVVHVSNHGYQRQLMSKGVVSRILPLFSNIPFVPLTKQTLKDSSVWVFVTFGSIHPDWSPEPLLQRIEEARKISGVARCRFVSIGNSGIHGANLWNALGAKSKSIYPEFEFIRLGEMTAVRISEELQNADFGLAIAPSLIIGKSGAVAAMLAHGLPVIISRLSPNCDVFHQSLRSSGRYILLNSDFPHSLGAARKFPSCDRLQATASQFIVDLELAR